jgi:hypothetical protein
MSSNVYSVGLRNAGSYQVSGQPYLSGAVSSDVIGSVLSSSFDFPFVTKTVRVTNEDSVNNLIVSFSPFLDSQKATYNYSNSASGSGNWLFLSASTSIEMNVKSKQIFVAPAQNATAECSIYAELTNIPTSSLYSYDGLEGISSISAQPAQNSIYGVGISNVGSYLVSGQPYITGSYIETTENKIASGDEITVEFPQVVKTFSVWNYSSDPLSKLRITFANTGSIQNYPACYIELAQNETTTLNVKCKEIYLSAVSGDVLWKVYGSLTGIPRQRMYTLTGSGITH